MAEAPESRAAWIVRAKVTFLWFLTRSAVLDFKIDLTGEEREERDERDEVEHVVSAVVTVCVEAKALVC